MSTSFISNIINAKNQRNGHAPEYTLSNQKLNEVLRIKCWRQRSFCRN